MKIIHSADIEYRYVKIRMGCQKGYKVYCNGEPVGQVIQDWEKSWGGNCWTIRREGQQKVTFKTRLDAARHLRYIAQEESA
jgi:hypothetical protein